MIVMHFVFVLSTDYVIVVKLLMELFVMIYNIIQYPDERLRRKAEKVTDFTCPKFQEIVDNVIATVKATAHCQGLAACQLDIPGIPPHLTVFIILKKWIKSL